MRNSEKFKKAKLLVTEAEKLAITLGVCELEGGWSNLDELCDLEDRLLLQARAVRRLLRRAEHLQGFYAEEHERLTRTKESKL